MPRVIRGLFQNVKRKNVKRKFPHPTVSTQNVPSWILPSNQRLICRPTFQSAPNINLSAGSDAFTLTWSDLPQKVYANPHWNLIGRVLSQACSQRTRELILIAPVWKAQAWYPLLLQRLVILIQKLSEMIQPVCKNHLPGSLF